MDLVVTLEKKAKLIEDELIYQELAEKVNFDILTRRNRVPTLTEVLFKKSDESMLTIKEMLGIDAV